MGSEMIQRPRRRHAPAERRTAASRSSTASASTSRRARSCAITGPSGSGKSTLLGLIAGLDTPERGLDRRRRRRDHRPRRGRARALPPRHDRLRVPVLSPDPDARPPSRTSPSRSSSSACPTRSRRARAPARRGRARRARRITIRSQLSGRRAAARRARARGRARPPDCSWPTSRPATSTPPPAPQIIELLLALNRERGIHARAGDARRGARRPRGPADRAA